MRRYLEVTERALTHQHVYKMSYLYLGRSVGAFDQECLDKISLVILVIWNTEKAFVPKHVPHLQDI